MIQAIRNILNANNLRAERDFLATRIGRWPNRDQGASSDQMIVTALLGGDSDYYPRDLSDLGRCERTYASAPRSLQRKMKPMLDRYRTELAKENT